MGSNFRTPVAHDILGVEPRSCTELYCYWQEHYSDSVWLCRLHRFTFTRSTATSKVCLLLPRSLIFHNVSAASIRFIWRLRDSHSDHTIHQESHSGSHRPPRRAQGPFGVPKQLCLRLVGHPICFTIPSSTDTPPCGSQCRRIFYRGLYRTTD